MKSIAGFTLAELLLCLAIMGLVLFTGLPALDQLAGNQQIISTAQRLHASLLLARGEAIKRRRPVLVDNGGDSWSAGWRVYADANGNGAFDPGDTLIRLEPALADRLKAAGNTPVRRYVRYTPLGRTELVGGGFQAGTISVCANRADQHVRRLIVSASGRPRLVREPVGTC